MSVVPATFAAMTDITLDLGSITIDSADAAGLASWWSATLGAPVEAYPESGFHILRADALHGLVLGFQQVGDPTPGKNKVHLDFTVADRPGTVAGLIDRGAARVSAPADDAVGWTVLADPDGNQFCVADRSDQGADAS